MEQPKVNTTAKQLLVETVIIKDIRGKELKYIRITNGDVSYAISVGDKTFTAVGELINPTPQKEPTTKIKGIGGKP